MNFSYVLNTLPTLVDISKKLYDTFKKEQSNTGANKNATVPDKISEIENAILQQADLSTKLAEQVKSMADELNRQKKLLYVSLTVSVVAVIVAVVAVVVR